MAKTPYKKLKKEVWKWCSLYIRYRDAVSQKEEWGHCCSCEKIVQLKRADAGHFIGRGSGGSSGVYFDERNIHLQCKVCNGFGQGNHSGYRRFILKKYGQVVIDELERLHHTHNYTLMELEGLKLYFQQEYKRLRNGQ